MNVLSTQTISYFAYLRLEEQTRLKKRLQQKKARKRLRRISPLGGGGTCFGFGYSRQNGLAGIGGIIGLSGLTLLACVCQGKHPKLCSIGVLVYRSNGNSIRITGKKETICLVGMEEVKYVCKIKYSERGM